MFAEGVAIYIADLNMVLTEALGMRREISLLLRETGDNENGDVSGLDNKLADIEDKMVYLTLPVAETSRL